MAAKGIRGALRRWAPWLLTVVVVAFLLGRYSPQSVAAELAAGNALAVVPWVLVVSVVTLFSMATADWLLFSAALPGQLRWWDVVRGRGGSTMLLALSYGVSAGGYGVWLARRTGGSLSSTIAAMLYQMFADLAAMAWFAFAAVVLGGHRLPENIRTPLLVASGVVAVALSLRAALGIRWIPRRFRESRFLEPLRTVGPRRYFASIAIRIASLAVNVICTYMAAQAFGLRIPLSAMAVGLPAVYLVGALPINVAGLGAVTAAWVSVFEPYAGGPEILAFQFLYQMVHTVLLVVRGLPFVSSVARDINEPASADNKSALPDEDPRESTAK